MSLAGLRVALVGPMPPPEGGMANLTRQLAELLEREGAVVTVVRTNTPYWPSWIAKWRFLRELFRLVPYSERLWRASGSADVFHVMANSGWAWHLCAAPAILIGRARSVPVIVNYHGGGAQTFLQGSSRVFLKTLGCASALTVPSDFLKQVFARWGVRSDVVPNVIDLERFRPGNGSGLNPHLVVSRALEPIYNIATALRAFALVRKDVLEAKLTVAGTGPDEDALRRLASELGISGAVHFCGRLDRDRMAELYRSAFVVLNPSRVDNMPISVLEAMASGVPVVSTNVGGVPFIVRDGVTALLVPAGDHAAMAAAALQLLRNPGYAAQIRDAALREVQQYAWQRVRHRWSSIYDAARAGTRVERRTA
jgi:glycosyltransferase involved in cell wall biosynthesis